VRFFVDENLSPILAELARSDSGQSLATAVSSGGSIPGYLLWCCAAKS
jgi:hypothetical protein